MKRLKQPFKLRRLIICSSIGILILLVFQIVWIRSSYEMSKRTLRKHVQLSLDNVIKKLDVVEALDLSKNEFNSRLTWLKNESKDSVSIYENVFKKSIVKKQSIGSEALDDDFPVFSIDVKNENKDVYSMNENAGSSISDNSIIKNSNKGLEENNNTLSPTNYDKIVAKFMYVAKYYEAISVGDVTLQQRINFELLDSLIRNEMKDVYGKNIKYEYAIKDIKKDEFIYTNGSSPLDKYRDNAIQANLFPNDLYSSAGTLYFLISNEFSLLVSDIWMLSLLSIILLIILSTVLGSSLLVISKQKKLSVIKNDFINNMTHELKTPISIIFLATEALQDTDMRKNHTIIDRYLNVIHKENRRLSQQVEKVLQTATLDKGKHNLKLSAVDINSVIENAVHATRLNIENKGGKINMLLQATHHTIKADELHISNVIRNLIENAYKYTPKNPLITISTYNNDDDNITISVKDNGIGINKEQLARIFDKFYRVPTGNVHDVKGFGLGLFYVKTMIDAHEGEINVISEPNNGSEFLIVLPYNNNNHGKE